jgi:predicted amidohydrolase
LEDALSKHSDIRNSLIVLPEAFNNGKVYYDTPCQEPRLSTPCALKQLATISKKLELVFVAGLLDPPHNSAYLIDSDCPRLMGYKREQDPSGNYEPCQANGGIDNPIEYQDACIGALICLDARNNCHRVTANVEKSTRTHKIICLPASMSAGTFDSPDLPLRQYRKKYVVLANSNPPPEGSGSFIANTTGKKMGNSNFRKQHNCNRSGNLG